MVPAYAVTLVLLEGRRIRVRTVVLIGVAIAAVIAIATAIDLSRPRDDRTHLGRYVTRYGFGQTLSPGASCVLATRLR